MWAITSTSTAENGGYFRIAPGSLFVGASTRIPREGWSVVNARNALPATGVPDLGPCGVYHGVPDENRLVTDRAHRHGPCKSTVGGWLRQEENQYARQSAGGGVGPEGRARCGGWIGYDYGGPYAAVSSTSCGRTLTGYLKMVTTAPANAPRRKWTPAYDRYRMAAPGQCRAGDAARRRTSPARDRAKNSRTTTRAASNNMGPFEATIPLIRWLGARTHGDAWHRQRCENAATVWTGGAASGGGGSAAVLTRAIRRRLPDVAHRAAHRA